MGYGIHTLPQNAYGKIGYSGSNDYNGQSAQKSESKGKTTAVARTMKRILQESRQEQMNSQNKTGILQNQKKVNDVFSYSESIRNARTKAKDTSLKLKKLRYDFKSISSKILRSKTSTSAKQVASQARREVIRLKRQRQNGEYDEEELQSAIVHAQAMERVAKKKARHLQEEEMIKAAGGACLGELEEKKDPEELGEENTDDALEDGELSDEELEAYEEAGDWQDGIFSSIAYQDTIDYEELYRSYESMMMQELTDSISEDMFAVMEEQMSDMMNDMFENMKDLLSDMGLDELSEGIISGADKDMDPADFKMMKIKHRNREMKDIVKADSEYLKALFDRLAKEKGTPAIDMRMNNSSPSMGNAGGVIDCVSPASAIASSDLGFDMSV